MTDGKGGGARGARGAHNESGETRVEKDGIGEMVLPGDALYGLESARARENFSLDYRPVNMRLVYAMVKIKKAAAITFGKAAGASADNGEAEKFRAIAGACDRILTSPPAGLSEVFITDALQGGAGTSVHMNVNEALANIALDILGKKPGCYDVVHPLNDVNRFQSTNDVYPTALRIAAIEALRELAEECAKFQEVLQKKETEYGDIAKLGRTELMDAVPVTLGGEFGAYAQAAARDRWRLYKVEERLRQINLGGAAAGLAEAEGGKEDVHERRQYRFGVIEELRTITGIGLAAAEYPMDLTQNNDVFVEVSGLLKALAVNLSKIAGDIRLMNSGPRGGLGEIRLAPLQKGSTIMAGKVNPVIPEMVIQAGIKVMANDSAISIAASRGEFELNAFSPLIADSLLESISLLRRTCFLFRVKCLERLTPDRERCAELLDASWAFAASFVPALGYETVSRIIAEHQNNQEGNRQAARPADGTAEKIRRALEEAAVRAGNG
ncbi:MAG: aspartate ammonia-lyase [Treponema sp.]|jgi:aspartate ammonia-lyase|nr:aspartate ammonia-lyase [Treponema sp.]